jgi:hypothetical protein
MAQVEFTARALMTDCGTALAGLAMSFRRAEAIKSICPADAAPLDEKLKRTAGDGRTPRTKAKVA